MASYKYGPFAADRKRRRGESEAQKQRSGGSSGFLVILVVLVVLAGFVEARPAASSGPGAGAAAEG